MKKLLTLLLIAPFLFSCSSDDNEETQDYTSFMFYQPESIDVLQPNCIAGYKKDNNYYKLGDLGEMSKGKYSTEIRVDDGSIKEIYFFTDYNGVIRLDETYILRINSKNIFTIKSGTGGIAVTDKSDPTQYPQ